MALLNKPLILINISWKYIKQVFIHRKYLFQKVWPEIFIIIVVGLAESKCSEYLNTPPLVQYQYILLPDKLISSLFVQMDKLKYQKNI